MRLEWLEDIIAVAETGSLLHAAERRHLTQSAFSRRIRAIEDHVGISLFDRSRKPVQLRPATEAQRETIVRLVAELRQLTADLREGDIASHQRVVVVSQHALAAGLTSMLIQNARLQGDDIFLQLRSANQDECFAQLLARQANIAIVYRQHGIPHPVRPDFVEIAEIAEDYFIPVVASTHREAILTQIAKDELPLITYPTDVFLGQVLTRNILPRLPEGLKPQPRAETALTLASQEMAALGLGVAWVPRSLAAAAVETGRLCDLSDLADLPYCPLQITAVRLAGPPEEAEATIWRRFRDTSAMQQG